uniref:Amino acid transporter transmembrane domain-containing protein n=1 Tax=Amphimedon queenslandica TaxID=400682 RepID=A0A1X7SLJ0_AMPQE
DCSRSWTSFFNSIPFVCFAFQCHVSSIPVYSGLKKRSVGRFFLVIVAAVFLCTLLYSLTGSFGLITFSKKGLCINSDIMRNYCPTDIPLLKNRAKVLDLCDNGTNGFLLVTDFVTMELMDFFLSWIS